MGDVVADGDIQTDTGLSFDFNKSVGPQIAHGLEQGYEIAKGTAGWLSDRFAEADPTTQSWLKFGAGLVGTMVATRILAEVTGFNILRNGLVSFAIAVAGGVMLSGMGFGGDNKDAPAAPALESAGPTDAMVTPPAGTDTSAIVPGRNLPPPLPPPGMPG